MDERRRATLLTILKKEREVYVVKLEMLRKILMDYQVALENGYLDEIPKKYFKKKKLMADMRLCAQVIMDVDTIVMAIEEEYSEVQLIGSLYSGKSYPEIKAILKRADLGFEESTEIVILP